MLITLAGTGTASADAAGSAARFGWAMPPATGDIWNLDQALRVTQAGAESMWATQVAFAGSPDVAYAGVQADGFRLNGSRSDQAIFSAWGATASRADGGACGPVAGTTAHSCRLDLEVKAGSDYRVRLWRLDADNAGQWWGAWVQDKVTGIDHHVGDIRLSARSTALSNGVIDFISYFGSAPTCSGLPASAAVFGSPTANNGATAGSLTASSVSSGGCAAAALSPAAAGATLQLTPSATATPSPTTSGPPPSSPAPQPTTGSTPAPGTDATPSMPAPTTGTTPAAPHSPSTPLPPPVVPAPPTAASPVLPAPRTSYGNGPCTIVGTAGDDVLVGSVGDDVICAGPGNDTIYGIGGDDRIFGGDGNDTIYGATADSPYQGLQAAVANHLEGGSGDDLIIGGNHGDRIYGDSPPYSRNGTAPGDDALYGGSGNDAINGGDGNDYISTGGNSTLDQAWGDAGDDLMLSGPLTWSTVVRGGDGDDVLIPDLLRLSPLGNNAVGGKGNDVIITFNGMVDAYDPDDQVNLPLNSACSVKVDAGPPPAGPVPYEVECRLPWPSGVGSLANAFNFTVSADEQGRPSIGGDVAGGLASLKVEDWRELLAANPAGVSADVTIIDGPTLIGGYAFPVDLKI